MGSSSLLALETQRQGGKRVQGGTESKDSSGIPKYPDPFVAFFFFLVLHYLDLSVSCLDSFLPTVKGGILLVLYK